MFEEAGVNVGGFMGSESPPGGFNAVDIAVCTIEKANSIVNRLMEERKLSTISCVIVDEMHMIGDPGRGYLLELLLTKIFFICSQCENGNQSSVQVNGNQSSVQVIGMSATLPNIDMLASWLNADLYWTTFRPVPLSEHYKVGSIIYDHNSKQVSKIKDLGTIRGDEDGIVALCVEVLQEGNSVLIFCPTKNWCEKLSETIANFFASHFDLIEKKESGFKKASDIIDIEKSKIDDVLDQLRRCPVGLDKTMEKLIQSRVAYHHAGLTFDERDIVEGAFRNGVLKVLIATSTLSSGLSIFIIYSRTYLIIFF